MTRTNTGILAGTRVLGADNVAEAIDMAGLDWHVETTDIAPEGRYSPATLAGVDLSDWKATYYVKGGETTTLGIVGKGYHVIQNAELLAPLNYLRDEFGAEYVSAGTLRKGTVPFVQMRVPSLDRTFNGDVIEGYLLAKTSHDGSGALTVAMTPQVLLCSNGMRGAFGRAKAKVSIRHTANARVAVHLGADLLRQSEQMMDDIEGFARITSEIDLSISDVRDITNEVYGDPFDPRLSAREVGGRERSRQRVNRALLTTRRGRMTAWDVFQAITEADEWMRPVRGADDPDTLRARRTLEGRNDSRTAKIREAVERVALVG
jgi:phage/plasmid-like protein (TIGR03299 family)